jgi:hypothetical protein
MRFVMHVSLPVDKFNQKARDGSAAKLLGKILEETRPEAAYFCANDGKRGGYLIVNMDQTSEMPRLAEPWFLNFDATVEFMPAMTPEDLAKSGIEDIVRKWG